MAHYNYNSYHINIKHKSNPYFYQKYMKILKTYTITILTLIDYTNKKFDKNK